MKTNQFFEVKKVKLHTGLEGFNSPDIYGVYKSTGGESLGVIGKNFVPTQPKFIFDQFSKSLQQLKISPDSIEFNEMKGGKKVMFRAKVKEFKFTNQVKKNDVIEFRIGITTGYDGKTLTSMFLDTNRLVCTNGLKLWGSEFNIRLRNVKGNFGKINILCEDILRATNSIEIAEMNFKSLAQKKVTPKQQNAFIEKVTGLSMKDYADLTTKKQRILDDINESVAIEMKNAGNNAWALMNGITYFTNHFAEYGSSREDFLYVDKGLSLGNAAQEYALQFLN